MEAPEIYLKQAFKALAAGDKVERDRLCDLAEMAFQERERLQTLKQSDPVSRN